ncbi:MAG TPA: phosphoglycerate mutase family protein [Gaiellaceae bacterium]|nr:phosphoglycerate mutase family protein [Gaiellaceae bacterium]
MSTLLLRHARAGDREAWQGDDRLRPLDERGRRRAEELAGELRGVRTIRSSPYVRCVETVEPLAASLGLRVELDERLAEGASLDEALAALEDSVDGVACTHGDVVETVLGRPLKKGAYADVSNLVSTRLRS